MSPEAFAGLRRHLGLTQHAVGRGVGVTAASICTYECTGKGLAIHRILKARDKMLATWKIWEGRAA